MFRFTIRDVLLVMVAVLVALAIDHWRLVWTTRGHTESWADASST